MLWVRTRQQALMSAGRDSANYGSFPGVGLTVSAPVAMSGPTARRRQGKAGHARQQQRRQQQRRQQQQPNRLLL
jgi:hypothetical protein